MIQVKKKICSSCETEQIIWKNHNGNKYCRQCWLKNHSTPLPKKLPTPIKAKSDKISALDQLYTVARKKFLEQHSGCEARLSGCTLNATDVHHKKGRGQYYLDKETWLAVCRSCHTWIELHPIEAKELNFSTNRL